MKYINLFEQFIASAVELVNEKREDVGKYNTVKKVISELGRRPSEQDLAAFINNNYYDVTEVERGEDDPTANDKIADLVAFYKFDIDDWEIAWADAQNESVVTEARNYKESPDGKHMVKATVCYLKPMTGQRECKAIYFKSKHDALGFKDNVKGFPKGAAVEAIKESKTKYATDFTSFIFNEAVTVTPESDVKIDDYTSDNGEEIKAVEIVGAISSSETEDEFLDYFYGAYGQGAFTETDTATLVKYYNEYVEEVTAQETEDEEEAEKAEGGDDELDMDI